MRVFPCTSECVLEMWLHLLVVALALALLYALIVRQVVLTSLRRVYTREPKTLAELRFIVHILYGEADKVVLNQSKDRTSVIGRRAKAQQKNAKAKAAEEHRRKEALDTIKRRMGHKLKQRRAERAKKEKVGTSYSFW